MSSNINVNVLTEKNYKPSSDKTRIFPSTPDDEIVISGIAGRYPSCDNVGELRENLFNKVSCFSFCCTTKNEENSHIRLSCWKQKRSE